MAGEPPITLIGNLTGDRDRLRHRKRSIAVQPRSERFACEERRDQEDPPRGFLDGDQWDDPGMPDLGGVQHLLLEAREVERRRERRPASAIGRRLQLRAPRTISRRAQTNVRRAQRRPRPP